MLGVRALPRPCALVTLVARIKLVIPGVYQIEYGAITPLEALQDESEVRIAVLLPVNG